MDVTGKTPSNSLSRKTQPCSSRSLKSHLWNHFLDKNILLQKCLNLINTCCGNKMMLSRMRDATAELVSFHNGSSDSFQTWCVSGRGVPLHGWKSRIWISWCVEKLQPYKCRSTTGGNFKYKTICKKWFNTITDSFCWDCLRNTTQGLLDSCESDESNDVYHVMVSGSVSVPHQKNVRRGPSKVHRAERDAAVKHPHLTFTLMSELSASLL